MNHDTITGNHLNATAPTTSIAVIAVDATMTPVTSRLNAAAGLCCAKKWADAWRDR